MEKQNFCAELIAPDTWCIREPRHDTLDGGWATGYLVVGSKYGIMVDTGFGKTNLREFAQTLTNKPVRMCICTHGHGDHAGGACYFKTAFMTERAEQVMFEQKRRGLNFTNKPIEQLQILHVTDGSWIELGDRTLEVFVLEGHSPGSIAILDRKERILFTGDNIGDRDPEANADGGMLWYKDDEIQPSVQIVAQNTAKLIARRTDYDLVCWGHGHIPLDADIVEYFMLGCLLILDNDDDKPVPQEIDRNGNPKYKDLENTCSITIRNCRILYDKRFKHVTQEQPIGM